jgi:hypothetical protein
MNNKIKIVYKDLASFNSDWIANLVNQYFELVPYDSNSTYDKKSTVFYANIMSGFTLELDWFLNEGYAIIFDSLWEAKQAHTFRERPELNNHPNILIIRNLNWFWYNESLWYNHLGYNKYVPNRTYAKMAFMPMRHYNMQRDTLCHQLRPYLDDFIWSYVFKGRELPNGGDAMNDFNAQRLFDPKWYDDTCFSIVSESFFPKNTQSVFITEKTFKPMAFQHPFMIVSNPGTLDYLKSQEFETFENLFDESYDAAPNFVERINLIEKNIINYKKQPHSQLTLNKIQHNYNRFFDQALVKQRIVDEIINPILEHAKA